MTSYGNSTLRGLFDALKSISSIIIKNYCLQDCHGHHIHQEATIDATEFFLLTSRKHGQHSHTVTTVIILSKPSLPSVINATIVTTETKVIKIDTNIVI